MDFSQVKAGVETGELIKNEISLNNAEKRMRPLGLASGRPPSRTPRFPCRSQKHGYAAHHSLTYELENVAFYFAAHDLLFASD